MSTTDGNKSGDFVFFVYEPKVWVNAHYAALFGLCVAVQGFYWYQAISGYKQRLPSKKMRRYVNIMIPFMVGNILEVIGYAARAYSPNVDDKMIVYVIQSLTLLVAPAFMAATIYMVFGEVVRCLRADEYTLIPLKWFTKVFVIGDCFSLLLQFSGGGLTINNPDMGQKLVLGGLAIQIVFFSCFIVCMFIFARRAHKRPTLVSEDLKIERPVFGNWKYALVVLSVCSVLILIRSVYRVAEYGIGRDGVLMKTEVYLFALDAVMIFVSSFSFLTINYSKFLSSVYVQYASQDESMVQLRQL